MIAPVHVAPAPVAGCAARAHARALRVDLGHHDRRLELERPQLKGHETLVAGSQARFR